MVVSHHLESNESMEASLVMEPEDSEVEEGPLFCMAEASPTCVGFHGEPSLSGDAD